METDTQWGLTSQQRLIRNELLISIIKGGFNPDILEAALKRYSRQEIMTVAEIIFEPSNSLAVLEILTQIETQNTKVSRAATQLVSQLKPVIENYRKTSRNEVPSDLVIAEALRLLNERYSK